MKNFKKFISVCAIAVFLICFYSFLRGNDVFSGKFSNDAIAWYFLAKGIFCSLALYLLVKILESIRRSE